MKQVLLRLDDDVHKRLRRAAYEEHTTLTEILREGLALRLGLPQDRIAPLLERCGYQRKQGLGWDDLMEEAEQPEPPTTEQNGH